VTLDIGIKLEYCEELYHRCGVNILVVEYRGYGYSEGKPNENHMKMDAIVYLTNRV